MPIAGDQRWEQGSEYQWITPPEAPDPCPAPWEPGCVLAGCGRDALRLLLDHGRANWCWRRVYVPSYLCQEVVLSLSCSGLTIRIYADDPRLPIDPPAMSDGDVLLVVNTFGVRQRWTAASGYLGVVVEDHTHDPWSDWSRTSVADYCVASLRKTLPIPDGAVLWSPKGRDLPPAPMMTGHHEVAVCNKLQAMGLKSLYLLGYPVSKEEYRPLATAGEASLCGAEPSAASPIAVGLIKALDAVQWRRLRRSNYDRFVEALSSFHGLSVLRPQDRGSCPFSVLLVFEDAERRESVRQGLIARRVYPAVLWDMSQAAILLPAQSVALARRTLSLHCDGRYDKRDVERTIELFSEAARV